MWHMVPLHAFYISYHIRTTVRPLMASALAKTTSIPHSGMVLNCIFCLYVKTDIICRERESILLCQWLSDREWLGYERRMQRLPEELADSLHSHLGWNELSSLSFGLQCFGGKLVETLCCITENTVTERVFTKRVSNLCFSFVFCWSFFQRLHTDSSSFYCPRSLVWCSSRRRHYESGLLLFVSSSCQDGPFQPRQCRPLLPWYCCSICSHVTQRSKELMFSESFCSCILVTHWCLTSVTSVCVFHWFVFDTLTFMLINVCILMFHVVFQ